MRAGELTVPTDKVYDPSVHLSVGDITVDDAYRPSLLRVTIKQSKTDLFRKGINLFVGWTNSVLCPVGAVLGFLCVRGKKPGPLFIWADGRPLRRSRFTQEIWDTLSRAGVVQSRYCTHSFRIGAVTTAAVKGIEGSLIKMLGR